jgi:hypothetical protein
LNIKVLVATQKKYQLPKSTMYLPVHVGKELNKNTDLGYQPDNTYDNISKKNPNYCELTAMYWAWKNLKADAIGLVHYRRMLSLRRRRDFNCVLSKKNVEDLFNRANVILPKKRRYYIETNYSHYIHAHHKVPLDETKNIIIEKFPQYKDGFDYVMKQTSSHMFNMFIMKRPYFDEYCEWLFSILFELEKSIDISSYSVYEARVFGFVSELLMDVWLKTKGYKYIEVNAVHMEKINWFKKGGMFLIRKLNMRNDKRYGGTVSNKRDHSSI